MRDSRFDCHRRSHRQMCSDLRAATTENWYDRSDVVRLAVLRLTVIVTWRCHLSTAANQMAAIPNVFADNTRTRFCCTWKKCCQRRSQQDKKMNFDTVPPVQCVTFYPGETTPHRHSPELVSDGIMSTAPERWLSNTRTDRKQGPYEIQSGK